MHSQASQPELPLVISRADLAPHELKRLTTQGILVRVLPGRYVFADSYPVGNSFDALRHRQLTHISATRLTMSHRSVMSHASAAALHDLVVPGSDVRVHITEAHGNSRGKVGVVRHRNALPPEHVTTRHGVHVTTLERTVVDCARTLNPVDALIIADSASANGMDRAKALGIMNSLADRRGTRNGFWVLQHASNGSESPGETRTRALAIAAGLPSLRTQQKIRTDRGTFYADLACEEHRFILEYDGRDKYTSPEDLFAEKLREDAIRSTGWAVMRVTARDFRDAPAFVGKIREFARNCGARTLGKITPDVIAAFTHRAR